MVPYGIKLLAYCHQSDRIPPNDLGTDRIPLLSGIGAGNAHGMKLLANCHQADKIPLPNTLVTGNQLQSY